MTDHREAPAPTLKAIVGELADAGLTMDDAWRIARRVCALAERAEGSESRSTERTEGERELVERLKSLKRKLYDGVGWSLYVDAIDDAARLLAERAEPDGAMREVLEQIANYAENTVPAYFGGMDGKWVAKIARRALASAPQRAEESKCGRCHHCLQGVTNEDGWPVTASVMLVCPTCGNKRCPKASDHRLACTGSNESGQPGSVFGGAQRAGTEGDAGEPQGEP